MKILISRMALVKFNTSRAIAVESLARERAAAVITVIPAMYSKNSLRYYKAVTRESLKVGITVFE